MQFPKLRVCVMLCLNQLTNCSLSGGGSSSSSSSGGGGGSSIY